MVYHTNTPIIQSIRHFKKWQEDKLPFKYLTAEHRELIEAKCSTHAVRFPDVSYYSDPENERDYTEGALKYYLCDNKDCQYVMCANCYAAEPSPKKSKVDDMEEEACHADKFSLKEESGRAYFKASLMRKHNREKCCECGLYFKPI